MAESPTEEETRQWQRRLASQANNRGWMLAEQRSRTQAENAAMLHAAHAARHLWGPIGTGKNLALADLLLGHVHALLGHGPSAMQYANAAHAAGLSELHEAHHAKAFEVANTLSDPEDRKVFDATFAVIPTPK